MRDFSFCASLRSRNAHGHVTRAILYGNLQVTCGTLIPRTPFRASLRSRNAHGHVRRAILYRNLQGKCGTLSPRSFVQACAVEMHMDMSEEPFCTEIDRENAGRKFRDTRFVRVCAVEMHRDISQEPFCPEI